MTSVDYAAQYGYVTAEEKAEKKEWEERRRNRPRSDPEYVEQQTNKDNFALLQEINATFGKSPHSRGVCWQKSRVWHPAVKFNWQDPRKIRLYIGVGDIYMICEKKTNQFVFKKDNIPRGCILDPADPTLQSLSRFLRENYPDRSKKLSSD